MLLIAYKFQKDNSHIRMWATFASFTPDVGVGGHNLDGYVTNQALNYLYQFD